MITSAQVCETNLGNILRSHVKKDGRNTEKGEIENIQPWIVLERADRMKKLSKQFSPTKEGVSSGTDTLLL